MLPKKARGKRPPVSRSKLLRFVLKFLLFFALLALLWPFLSAGYNRLVSGAANGLLPLIERPVMTIVRADSDKILIYRRELGREEPLFFQALSGYIYSGLLPLLALFLATPGLGLLRRLKLALIALLVLVCFHIIYVVAAIELGYVFRGAGKVGVAQHYLYGWMQTLLTVLWEAISILIWGALTFRYWLPRPR
jgi:hypothetical protein